LTQQVQIRFHINKAFILEKIFHIRGLLVGEGKPYVHNTPTGIESH